MAYTFARASWLCGCLCSRRRRGPGGAQRSFSKKEAHSPNLFKGLCAGYQPVSKLGPGLENTAGSASVLCIIQYYYYTLYNTHCIILLRYWEEKRKKTAKKGSSRAKTPTCTRRLGARRDDHSRPWLPSLLPPCSVVSATTRRPSS